MLIVPPSALTELVPLPCRSLKKLFKKDCKAAVPVEPVPLALAVAAALALAAPAVVAALAELAAPVDGAVLPALPPVKALTRLLNAVLSVESVPEDKPAEPVEPLSS